LNWPLMAVWHYLAFIGSVWHCDMYSAFKKRLLLCKMIFMNRFTQKHLDKMERNENGIEPFFPVTFNPSRKADSCVHQNTASCVLSISKRFPMLKTTCPAGSQKTHSEVGILLELKKGKL